jgi:hypothetical protein
VVAIDPLLGLPGFHPVTKYLLMFFGEMTKMKKGQKKNKGNIQKREY